MTIGYDGLKAVKDYTGIGNYCRSLIATLSVHCPKNHYIVLSPEKNDNRLLSQIAIKGSVHLKKSRKALSTWWWRNISGIVGDAEHYGAQVFHGLSGELPLDIAQTKMPSVITVHNLTFRHHPEYYSLGYRLKRNFMLRHSCRKADKIVAVSECTKRDIIHFYGIESDKIEVIPEPCNELFYREVTHTAKLDAARKYHLPANFILVMGNITERKNIMQAVKALTLMENKDVMLVIVGEKNAYYKKLKAWAKEHHVYHRIKRVSGVETSYLPAIYHMAKALVYPSRHEGFGLSVLESIICGTPVIATTGSALEETGGKSSVYIDPDDTQALAEAIDRVLSDETLRQRMIADGLEHAKNYEPKAIAEAYNDLYHRLRDGK